MRKLLLATLVALCVPATAFANPELIENGDFSAGLSGWDSTINVLPAGGGALQSPAGVLPSTLGQDFASPFQTATVSFDWTITSTDLPFGGNGGPDPLNVFVDGNLVATIESDDPQNFVFIPFVGFVELISIPTVNGPNTVVLTNVPLANFNTPGGSNITFALGNVTNGEATSALIDNVSVIPNPEPASMLAWGLIGGVGIAAGTYRRRKLAAARKA